MADKYFVAAYQNFMTSGRMTKSYRKWTSNEWHPALRPVITAAIAKWWYGDDQEQAINVIIPERFRAELAAQVWSDEVRNAA